jgi:hypothetical protein
MKFHANKVLLYPKLGVNPNNFLIELFANSNEACNNFAKKVFTQTPKVTYLLPNLPLKDLMISNYKFLTTKVF